MAGLLFVTAPEADFKIINHALLCMRDWDESDGSLDAFELMTDKVAIQNGNDGTSLPLESLPENAWSGAKLEDIEAYCMELERGDDEHKGASLFVTIDSADLKTKTCILGSMPDDDAESPDTFPGRYDKFRVPWDDVYVIWCNLDIANMNFEEFVEEEEGNTRGWFTYQSIYEDDDVHHANLERRDEKVERWRQQGHI